ncbi:MAG: pyridoxine 5'-phosphate synthase [Elusimicrobia bacterium]|nr:pyridoxine 5'-phosphate synthase [Elusimicrobiota bacterium]
MIKLALRVDYLAILKQKRSFSFPTWPEVSHCVAKGGGHALAANLSGKDNLLSEADLLELKRQAKLPLHLVAPLNTAVLASVARIAPQTVWLVAQASGNGSLPQGLKLDKVQAQATRALETLKRKRIRPFLVVEPDAGAIRLAKRIGAQGVALNGWPLIQAKSRGQRERIFEDLNVAGRLVRELELELHIGGEVDYQTVEELTEIPDVSFVHAGLAVTARGLTAGLQAAVEELMEEVCPAASESPLTLEA